LKHLILLLLLIVHLFANIPTYNKVGNLVTKTIDGIETSYSYNANDQLISKGSITYTYDANGNMLTETLDGETTTYTYNSRNQLVQTVTPTQTIRYTYNSNGIRTSKTVDNTTTHYLVDEHQAYAQVLQESIDGTTEVRYTYGSDLISQRRANKTTTYHYDGLGSARYLSDDTGALTDSYDYEAFGKLLNAEGNTSNHYRYTGEQQDEETKQYYLRARYYAPTTGRFTQQDTYMGNSADPVSLHKYLYANANPVTYTDPTGHFGMTDAVMASNVQATLQNIQIESYSTILNVVTGGWDGVSLDDIPEMAATAVGLRLLLRFVPKLFHFYKEYKVPGYSTWSHIYNPKIANGTVKGFHHAPMGIVPPKIYPIRRHNNKHGFYSLDFRMSPQFGADPRKTPKYITKTMFPEEWSSIYVRKVVNKGYIKALVKGRGSDIELPLSDILGSKYDGVYLQYYMKRANGQPYVHPVIK
jgi:RHS repeat-associated protein